MQHILVSHVMTRQFASVTPQATLGDVVAIMHQNGHSCVMIIEGKRALGIVTEKDLVKVLASSLHDWMRASTPVTAFMTTQLTCIHPDTSLYEALVVSTGRKIRHLPVVDDDDCLQGVLTQNDVSKVHFTAIEQQREIIESQIRERTFELEQANQELKLLSLQDALLNIGNRRSMEVDLQFTHVNAKRYKRHYAVALIDVDHFKRFNDHYGHQAGDNALRQVTALIQSSMRNGDRLYRYGGEELLLLLQEVDIAGAWAVVDRIREHLITTGVEHLDSPLKLLSFSAGVEGFQVSDEDWKTVIARADANLYRAKSMGRNCVVADKISEPDKDVLTS